MANDKNLSISDWKQLTTKFWNLSVISTVELAVLG